jgi:hemin uptake protein HemP
MDQQTPEPGTHPSPPTSQREEEHPPRRLHSRELLDGGSRLVIAHGGCDYVLRITRRGKLILTK